MLPDPNSRPLYPPDYAFVVQLQAAYLTRDDQLRGRVEHVVSGRVAHFSSWDQVLAFMACILNEMDNEGAHVHPK